MNLSSAVSLPVSGACAPACLPAPHPSLLPVGVAEHRGTWSQGNPRKLSIYGSQNDRLGTEQSRKHLLLCLKGLWLRAAGIHVSDWRSGQQAPSLPAPAGGTLINEDPE